VQEIDAILHKTPREAGLNGNLWDGKTLAAWIDRQYGVRLGALVRAHVSPIGFPLAQTAPSYRAGQSKIAAITQKPSKR
jgi:hypothetical protein